MLNLLIRSIAIGSIRPEPMIHCRLHPETMEPWVFCAVCKKPVDWIEYMEDILTRNKVVTVYCHGRSERVILSPELLFTAHSIEIGDAFGDIG